ncbi:twin-arginine translocation protein [Brucella suis bv. 1 str. S2]|uniref:Sec-independent protein translocase protein TatB n=11 Tax=Brucella/Ochrobactrum group TaxID=2826938 RepID=A9MAQ6_BRUC2|nr:mttA/Hcf106 family protein [Brucella suis 1330]ABX61959.1 twin-arginine translocation protein TatB [Brucella canis ATCC 23365]ABY37988.1 twin-arginine translocation protein TatB [Brucella suis ATCC 23445]AEK54207.1 sec-independent translocase protein TatB [Brucella pinnipedialis B2/94]AEU05896.1 sec-independent translocase [Brucella suis VBI22]AHN46520.1 twin-arginine translocation protein [Brucella suis bv. 1 str. S2]EEH14421.1 twin-arginine translocation protein TatB [Brucella ceti str. 
MCAQSARYQIMFDIAWSELLIIAIVMIVVVGPKDLPKMLRAFGKATARMRTTANEFRHQFNEALKEAELEDVKTIIDEARSLDPRTRLTQVFDPIRSAGEDLRSGLQSATSMSPVTENKVGEVTTPVEPGGTPVPAPPVPVPMITAPEEPAKPRKTSPRPAAKAGPKPTTTKTAKKTGATPKPTADKTATPVKKTTKKTGTKA